MSGILRAKASTSLKVILKMTFHMKAIILKAKRVLAFRLAHGTAATAVVQPTPLKGYTYDPH